MYKKCFFIVFVSIYLPFFSFGQLERDIILNQEHLDVLIESALLNSPQLERSQISKRSIDFQRKRINNGWFKYITVGGNLNELSIKQFGDGSDNNIFFPRYNIGLNFPLSAFGEQGVKRRLLESDELMLDSQKEEIERNVRESVTKKYIAYLKEKQVLNIKQTLEQYLSADFKAIEKNFSEGGVDLEEYYAKRKEFYNFKSNVLDAESKYLMAKTELEAMVNASLSELGIE